MEKKEEKFSRKKIFASVAVLAVLVAAVFGQSVCFEYLRFDDHDYTFRCLFVKDGLSLKNILVAFSSVTHAAIWMPVTYISYMCDISLFGNSPSGHHFTNVVLHILNTFLLLKLATSILRTVRPCVGNKRLLLFIGFAIAAFWAIHPQRAEAVAWIAGRKDLLCTFFTFLGLIVWKGLIEESLNKGAYVGRFVRYAVSFLCFILAVMCKPSAMSFPILAYCVELLTVKYAQCADGEKRKSFSLRTVFSYLPFLAVSVGAGMLAVYSQTHALGYEARELFSAPLWWRLLNAAVALGLYLYMTVVPFGIHLDYRAVPGGLPLGWSIGLLTLFLFCFALWYVWKKHENMRVALFCCVLWFLASIGPTLGVFGSFGEHAMADRFYYLPSVGLLMLAGIFLSFIEGWLKAGKTLIVFSALLALFAGTAFTVTRAYRSDYEVFQRTLRCDENHWRALAHVGEGDCAQGKMDDGIAKLSKSYGISPRFDTKAKLAYALMRRGRTEDFERIFELCSDVAKNRRLDRKGQVLEALGTAALVKRNWKTAMLCLYDSLRAPLHFYSKEDARLKLAYALYNAGRKEEAFKWFESCTKSTRPDISAKASQALETIEALGKRNAILYW